MSFLNQLENLAKNALDNFKIFDPTTLNDVVASKTDWNPMQVSGTNFSTNKLVEESVNVLVYKPTFMAYAFPSIFLFMFIIGPLVMSLNFYERFGSIVFLVAGLFSLSSIALGIYLLRTMIKPKIFDKMSGMYFKGKTPPMIQINQPTKNHCRLNEIYAIQLLRKYSRSSSDNSQSQTYYQINLVLKDTFRINIISLTDLYKVRNDADKISKFLGIPVWDAI